MKAGQRGSRAAAGAVGVAALAFLISAHPAPAASPPSVSAPCAWAGESDQRDVNIGAPDLDAYYVADNLPVSAGERVRIHGEYPFARYFSFHVYSDRSLLAVGTIYDRQIGPARGSSNPFRGPVRPGAGDMYTAYVDFAPAPRHPARNTVYVNARGLGPSAMLIYRIYVPTDPSSAGGSVAYPEVAIQNARGSTILSQPGCATVTPRGGSAVYSEFANLDYPSFLPAQQVAGATRVPTWTRSFGSQLGNRQNAYLGAIISRRYGQLVVIHARAPSFPNSRAGAPVYGPHQVRYWSFCTYDAQGQAGYGCAADYAAAVRHGQITYVISDPGTRPRNAVARNGVTWLPWGGQQYSAQIVERNMLPTPRFAHAIQRISRSGAHDNPRRVMGAYFPRAVYCTTRRFEQGGWRACFRAAGVTRGPDPYPVQTSTITPPRLRPEGRSMCVPTAVQCALNGHDTPNRNVP